MGRLHLHYVVRSLVPALLPAAGLSSAVGQEAAVVRAERERHLGPAIASTADFSVHSREAVAAGSGWRCVLPQGSPMSDAEFSARRDAVMKPLLAEQESIREQKAALMNGQRSPNPLPQDVYRERANALTTRESAVMEQLSAEDRKLQEEHRRSRLSTRQPLVLYLLHTPADPGRTIVPLSNSYPTPDFVAGLNRTLRSFLASCGDTEFVGTYHYYRDAIPFGMSSAQSLEPAIVSYGYTLRGGALTVARANESDVWRLTRDPVRNRRLTLGGLRAENEALQAEQSRRNADYRADHLVAAKRRPGIVYKLDAYWSAYRNPDLARRIFDGDFGSYARTAEFRMLFLGYAQLFSTRCARQVKSFVGMPEAVSVNHRSELDPVTGLWVPKSDRKIVVDSIDSRFAGRYRAYEADVTNAYMARILGQMKEMERGERKRASEWTAEDFANAVTGEREHLQHMAGVFPAFFDNHACTSAAMEQMGANILRAAEGQPSVQEAGVRLPNADRESDPTP